MKVDRLLETPDDAGNYGDDNAYDGDDDHFDIDGSMHRIAS